MANNFEMKLHILHTFRQAQVPFWNMKIVRYMTVSDVYIVCRTASMTHRL